ncbi:MAG: formylmethanofuran dehydrogenase subunit C [Candidatus Bathyarchaeota archaeon]|nr:MAG: formylmethanofuran dehydrogenase subunit C [Candidatus Bathyarchaeota archaeon]
MRRGFRSTMIILTPKRSFTVPVGGECISPDTFAAKSTSEMANLPVWEGNKKRALGHLFRIELKTAPSESLTIRIRGDAGRIRRIGAKMSSGRIVIEGNAGMHLGEEMNGGAITVVGNAGSWAGSRMKKGTIEIKGDAGHYIGAAYRGSNKGMNGGAITIYGNAGNEVGCFMRKGLIKIHGDVGQFTGIHMKNGTIYIGGDSEVRAGAQMLGGKIVVLGRIPSILPTFTIDDIKSRVKIDGEKVEGPFYRFLGDLAENGNGKLFISQKQNTHLTPCERFL